MVTNLPIRCSLFTPSLGDNASLVKTLPPGLLINFTLNQFVVMFMMYLVMKYLKLDYLTYLSFSVPLMMGKFILQMAIIHPFIHTQHTSWYGAYISPIIPKYFMDDYQGHVLCHHVNGYCLGDSPVYSKIYNVLLYLHGELYKNDWVRFQTPLHYVVNILLDYLLLASIFALMFITVLVMYPVLPKLREEKIKTKKIE